MNTRAPRKVEKKKDDRERPRRLVATTIISPFRDRGEPGAYFEYI